MATGRCRRSPGAGMEAMVAVVDGPGRIMYGTFKYQYYSYRTTSHLLFLVVGRRAAVEKLGSRQYDTLRILFVRGFQVPEFLRRENVDFCPTWDGKVSKGSKYTQKAIQGYNNFLHTINNKLFFEKQSVVFGRTC